LRILIVSNLYPDARLPAFGTFVAGHAEALRRAGADVNVLAIKGIPAHKAVLRKYAMLTLRSLLVALLARLTRRRPQIVEAHIAYPTALPAWLASRIVGAHLVVYSHGSDITGDGADGVGRLTAGSGFHRKLARRVFRAADLHVATSAFVGSQLASRFGVDRGRIIVLSPGVDFTLFSKRTSTGSRGGILYVGRLASGKGVHELLSAVARLGNGTELRFVGDGPERAALEREALASGIRVTFDGALPPGGVATAMQEAAVVAMPSIYPEGLGLVALEGMAAGALVVASDVGGVSESVIDGQTGWLVPPGDVEALASALADAMTIANANGSSRRAALLERASAHALEQDVDANARKTLAAYDSLGGR
jgi:glycosyltransferase involved in cell wall biosynthesis